MDAVLPSDICDWSILMTFLLLIFGRFCLVNFYEELKNNNTPSVQ